MVRLSSAQISAPNGGRLTAREWVVGAHSPTAKTLPRNAREALFPQTLRDHQGQPLEIYPYLGLNPALLDSIYGNPSGVLYSARLAGPPPGTDPSPPWQGFTDVTVPLCDGAKLHLRLGTPEPPDEIRGSYVVITHGMFGSLEGVGMLNHVQALRRAGHHVLAIEMRGHGQTSESSAHLPMTFGLKETADLLAIARWLKTEHHARRVGLVAFSVSGFESLLAAWLDAAPLAPADAARPILRYVPTPAAEPAFNGGMFIISAPVGIHTMAQVLEQRWHKLQAPVKYTFQQRVEQRLREFGDPAPRDLWDFVIAELRRDGWVRAYGSKAKLRADMDWFLDLQRNNWAAGAHRMEAVRVPILILSAANDPLGTGQDVAELFARVKNPNLGVILLKDGGHMGFAALSADYFYSLMTEFFHPATAPRRVDPPRH